MPHPKVKIADNSGNEVGVTSNALDVNIAGGATIDIGDVDMFLDGGTAVLGGAGAVAAGVLRVTLASDDPAVALLGTIDADTGIIVTLTTALLADLSSIDTNTGNLSGILSAVSSTTAANGAIQGGGGSYGQSILGVRNDVLAPIGSAVDGDYSLIQVNALGALYITGGEVENAAVQSEPTLIGGRYDSSARTLGDGDAGAVALNASGHVLMDVVDGGQLDTILDTLETTLTAIETDQAAIEALLTTIDTDTGNTAGYLSNLNGTQYVDDANWTDSSSKHLLVGGLYQSSMQTVTDGDVAPFQIDANGVLKVSPSTGSEFQVDVVAALPAGTNAIGKLAANSGVDIGDVDVTSISAGTNAIGKVGHDITGILSDDNPTVGTSAEAITTDGADGAAACKRMDIMSHPSNTGEIWVGDAAVTTNGLNGGIRLLPGDVYSIDIDNTGDIYVIATVDGENVSYNYFT